MSQAFKANHRIGTVPAWTRTGERPVSVFVTVEFTADGRLSITGVEGPTSSGDAAGSCGQIDSTLREHLDAGRFVPAEGWTLDRVRGLLDIWDAWHLNDMSAADDVMIRDGWREQAAVPVWLHTFTQTLDGINASNAAKDAALDALKAGSTFTPTAEQSAAYAAPYSVTIYTDSPDDVPETPAGYKPGDKHPERKTLGWLKPDEHPRGLLTKLHPESGNRYGSGWYRRDVPADVLATLKGYPLADRPHPWRNA